MVNDLHCFQTSSAALGSYHYLDHRGGSEIRAVNNPVFHNPPHSKVRNFMTLPIQYVGELHDPPHLQDETLIQDGI